MPFHPPFFEMQEGFFFSSFRGGNSEKKESRKKKDGSVQSKNKRRIGTTTLLPRFERRLRNLSFCISFCIWAFTKFVGENLKTIEGAKK